jgi:RNase P subunit RPR2
VTRRTATQRIAKLFDEARRVADEEPGLADHYMKRAWRIKLTVNASFTRRQRLQFCKSCKRFIAASDIHVRLNDGVQTRTCPHCHYHERIRYDLD